MSEEKNHKAPLDNPELKQNIFSTPEGYFEALSSKIEDAIAAEESELTQNEHLKSPVFDTPESYFDQLADKIQGAAETEDSELNQNTHLQESPFGVPEGYFEGLAEKIEASTQEEETEGAKVVPMYQRNWFKMAVAVVLVLGFFIFRGGTGETGTELLADLNEDEAIEYLLEDSGDLELLASVDGFESAIAEILEEETADYGYNTELNLELDYDFEYFEQ